MARHFVILAFAALWREGELTLNEELAEARWIDASELAGLRTTEGLAEIVAAGARWWPLAMARELDDALLMLRANHHDIGTWVFKTSGAPDAVLACDAALAVHRDHWFVRETIGLLRRTLQRFDVSSRSLFAVIEEGSCFAGSLFELALAADRSYMRAEGPRVALSLLNFCDL